MKDQELLLSQKKEINMTKCDKCGKESGDLLCGHCRAEIKGTAEKKFKDEKSGLIPLLFWDPVTESYTIGCQCLECSFNAEGYCITEHKMFETLLRLLLSPRCL